MARLTPRVFTIPASAPFVPTLIAALREGRLVEGFRATQDPLALANVTLYLSTRRACRLARDLFLDVTGQDAAILPRIVAIGDVDEDEIVFAQAAMPAAEALELPDAIENAERRFLLTRLVMAWAASPEVRVQGRAPLVADNPAAALALADDLARLMDDMTTRQVPWQRLDEIVPDKFDVYWQYTLRFLKIARDAWPDILRQEGKIEPAQRRDLLIAAEAKRLAAKTDGPVIAAGSTGSMPATAALLATIAKLRHGAVVLPGLDTDLDDPSWELIGGKPATTGSDEIAPAIGHPQFAMQALLRQIGVARADVRTLGEAAVLGRARFVSEALRPALATDLWQGLAQGTFAADAAGALKDFSVIEAANAEDEALAIAVALRETLQEPGKTAALVTPDRALARRVLAALGRWNVAVDDSGGDGLADTAAGTFARLAAETALGGIAPVPLLALLKHPLLRLGAPEATHARAIAALERAVLRGPRPRPGTPGLIDALAAFRVELAKLRKGERSDLHPSDPRTAVSDSDLQAAANLAVELTAALGGLEGLRAGRHPFANLAASHRRVVEMLSEDGTGACAAFADAGGKALSEAFDEIAESQAAAALAVTLGDYPELFHTAIGGRVVRRPGLPGVRVRIYGPLEARLQHVDRIVLGGLVEGTWPPETRSDPWLSRPMRQQLGLDLPERRISLSAHDFAQALGAREVVLSHPAKLGGAPTVASRFVQRLAAVAGQGWTDACANGRKYVDWGRALDRPAAVTPIPRPEPKPPVAARPTRLSVTEIEDWLRDPYTIYARHILKLRELDPVDLAPGAADRGTVIHGAIGDFTQAYAQALPDDPFEALLALGRTHFAPLKEFPEASAFWWPRFLRIARWFANWETGRRASQVASVLAEIQGRHDIPLGERTFTLSVRADRIERLADGRYAILDYKTGRIPGHDEVKVGFAPQLTLEAAILRVGEFTAIPAGGSVAELIYVSLKGGDPAGDEKSVKLKDSDPDTEADKAMDKLRGVAARFENAEQPYRSLLHPMWKTRYGTYDHLARVKEWSSGLDDEELFP